MLLEEEMDAMMVDPNDDDDDVASPSSAVDYATKMLAPSRAETGTKEVQQPAAPLLSRRESSRVPVQKNEGKKRTCCSASAMSVSPSPLYGEVA